MAKQRMKSELVKIVTPEFRAGFPALFEARKANPTSATEKAKFSIVMLFQVADTAQSKKENRSKVDLEPLKNLVRNVIIEKFGADRTKWPKFGVNSGELQTPFRKGDVPEKKDKPGFGEGIEFAAASTLNKPGIVQPWAGPDNRPAPLTVPSDFYGGCYARATVNAYYWEYMGKMGVSLSLQNVQKLRDGEPFGGRTAADKDFDAIEAAVPAGAPAAASGSQSESGV